MSHIADEIASQPACWMQVHAQAHTYASVLPQDGERVAVVGCGTSWFMGQAYASLRESRGRGETDAFPASEMSVGRRYDRVVAISRSGTTTEVVELLEQLRGRMPTVAITADSDTPIVRAADEVLVLGFADERSVVQTRFATTTLILMRSLLGDDVPMVTADAEKALAAELDPYLVTAEQITFLGQRWTVGLAHEAALKLREATGAWTESYPAMEYRHGPISVTGPHRAVWMFGTPPPGLADEVAATGGRLITSDLDPLADLIRAQRLAATIAAVNGRDPDNPRHLTRSVILPSTA